MDILNSLEVRWFLHAGDALVAEFAEWFKDEPLENDGDRRDLYYVDAERPDLNAKARGGKNPKLEYKYRIGTLESMRLTANVAGNVERWTKLSLPVDAALANEPQVIAVSKQRRQRKFAIDGANVVPVAVNARPEAGCGVEFTTITASHGTATATACTFGFEAFGPAPVSIAALTSTVLLVLAERPNLQLRAAQSENYSSWLIRNFGSLAPPAVEHA